MNYVGMTISLNNGDGVRLVLYVSGCNHHCHACHNEYTWNPKEGNLFDSNTMDKLLKRVNKPYVDGLTLSGGDPMYPQNRNVINDIARIVKLSTKKSIWMYTGYLWEQIKDDPVMSYIDVIVDGKYQKELSPAKYRGSSNQRIIDVRKSLKTGGIVLWV